MSTTQVDGERHTVTAIQKKIADGLKNLLRNIEHIWQLCWRLGFYRGGAVFMSALSGIDIALWDLKGTFFEDTFVIH